MQEAQLEELQSALDMLGSADGQGSGQDGDQGGSQDSEEGGGQDSE